MKQDAGSYLERVDAQLEAVRAAGRYRTVRSEPLPPGTIDFSSNDYLAMATDTRVVQALRHATRAGSGGARLLGGASREHALLEEELALWLGRERALLFTSGYHAALGVIPVLGEAIGAIESDERNHACLIDGVRLTRANKAIYPHGAARPAGGPALVITESIFSMDGDAIDPRALLGSLGPPDALLIDEAHALGVAGTAGAGLAHGIDDDRVVVLGTLSKALGGLGGFVAGPSRVVELCVNRARTFIFDTALPPAIALAARIALRLVRDADDRRAQLHANAARLREGLSAIGFERRNEFAASPVVSLELGSEERALAVAARLFDRGIFAPAIRPPTVPPGTSRLRFSVRSNHTPESIDRLLAELSACAVIS